MTTQDLPAQGAAHLRFKRKISDGPLGFTVAGTCNCSQGQCRLRRLASLGYAPSDGWCHWHLSWGAMVVMPSMLHATARKKRIYTTTLRNLESQAANQCWVKQLSHMADGKRENLPSQYEQEHFVLENITLLSGTAQHFLQTNLLGDPLPGHTACELSSVVPLPADPVCMTHRLLCTRGGTQKHLSKCWTSANRHYRERTTRGNPSPLAAFQSRHTATRSNKSPNTHARKQRLK